ncbi:MAG: hypothetical protein AAF512_01720 [Pseudomonadota bacterium]
MSDFDTVLSNLRNVSNEFAANATERRQRRQLERADFDQLATAGFLRVGVPASMGGLWQGLEQSVRPYNEMVHTIAQGDPCVGLVAAMHPCVLAYWLAEVNAPDTYIDAWEAQRTRCFKTALDGHWWGTLTSEPGSGGDIMRTRTLAEPMTGDERHRLTGDKHFGSGSGISSFMTTTAREKDAEFPVLYFMDMREARWDGSQGLQIISEWDGHGMIATQSHAFRLEKFPATPMAWPDGLPEVMKTAAPLAGSLFTSVIVAVVEQAVEFVREKLAPKQDTMRPYEQVEWSRAVNEAWLIRQAYDGMLRAVENNENGLVAVTRGKAAIAELSESCLQRLSRVAGGASFARSMPLGQWAQDVRALGFLRPPWGLAYDNVFKMSWE